MGQHLSVLTSSTGFLLCGLVLGPPSPVQCQPCLSAPGLNLRPFPLVVRIIGTFFGENTL